MSDAEQIFVAGKEEEDEIKVGNVLFSPVYFALYECK